MEAHEARSERIHLTLIGRKDTWDTFFSSPAFITRLFSSVPSSSTRRSTDIVPTWHAIETRASSEYHLPISSIEASITIDSLQKRSRSSQRIIVDDHLRARRSDEEERNQTHLHHRWSWQQLGQRPGSMWTDPSICQRLSQGCNRENTNTLWVKTVVRRFASTSSSR